MDQLNIPKHLRHLPRIYVYLDNGDELGSMLIDIDKTSSEDLTRILRENLIASGTFDTCLTFFDLFVRREGNKLFIWPLCEHGQRIELSVEDIE